MSIVKSPEDYRELRPILKLAKLMWSSASLLYLLDSFAACCDFAPRTVWPTVTTCIIIVRVVMLYGCMMTDVRLALDAG